jgi:predicted DNA-binding transcriptional regulator AlpA
MPKPAKSKLAFSNQERVYRVKDVAAFLGISIPSLYRLRSTDPLFPSASILNKRTPVWLYQELVEYVRAKKGLN